MPHQIERKFAFGPSALNDLAQAFDAAWLELRGWGIEANTDEQVQSIKTKLAERIMEYAVEGEHDVEHLKEFGLQGLPHLCAHRVGLPRRAFITNGRPYDAVVVPSPARWKRA